MTQNIYTENAIIICGTMPESEFMNWRAGERYRDLVEKIRQKKNLSSNSDVIRLALDNLAKREKIKA